MNKLKLILFLLILTQNAFAVDSLSCSTDDIEIKATGFLGLGQEAKIEKTIGKLTTRTNETSIYERSFEIGAYRFVKEKDGFITYRKNEAGAYAQLDIKGQVKVSNDHPIFVSNREGNTLIIRRLGDDKNKQEMIIIFDKNQMSVKVNKGGSYSEILKYTLCPKGTSRPPSTKTMDKRVNTGN